MSRTMNSSNVANKNSRFSNSNEMKSDFSFNAPSVPVSDSAAASGLTKPRLSKTRRPPGSIHSRSSSSKGARVNPLYNPFGSDSLNLKPVLLGGEFSEKDDAFVFGVSQSDSRAKVDKDVADEMRELNIGRKEGSLNAKASDFNSSSTANISLNADEGLGTRAFVFKGSSTEPLSVDETKVADEMMKLNLGHLGSDESVGKNKDIDKNLSANDKTRFGLGMGENVHSSVGKYVESELPTEFTKLTIKSTQVLDGSHLLFNADVKKQSAFNSTSNSVFSAGTSDTVLQDQMRNLNVKDSVNANGIKKNMVDSKSSLDTKFTLGSDTVTVDSSRMKTDVKMSNMMANMKIESEKGNSSIQTGRFSSFPGIYINSQKIGSLSEERLNDGGESIPTGFIFEAAIPVKDAHFKSNENISEPPTSNVPGKKDEFHFTTKQDGAGSSHSVFNTPNAKGNVFSSLNQKSDITGRKVIANNIRSKKGRGQSRQHNPPVQVWLGPNFDTSGSISSQDSSVSPMAYSPMDVSPYEERLADNRSRENSVASDDAFPVDESSDSHPIASNDAMDEDLASVTQRMHISEGVEKSEEEKEGSCEYHFERNASSEVHEEESIYSAETESFATANEDLDDEASASSSESQGSDKLQFFSTRSQATSGTNFVFVSSSSAQGQASSGARQRKKKNRPSVGIDSASSTTLSGKSHHSSSHVQFPLSGVSSILSPRYSHTEDASTFQRRRNEFEVNKEQEAKQGSTSTSATAVAAQEACEKWRLRGNQSYSNGDLLKAEEYYTHGVDCISRSETSRSCLRALMLCYSNRAATRMSLGRMRDAVKDCMLAVAIDPSFLRVQLRAANCYLDLGEVEQALQYFKKCLQPGSDVCVDRKIMVEASEGIQKAQKVSKCLNKSTELLHLKTSIDAESALSIIYEALTISPHSESLLEMKAVALFLLRKYKEVIQICEQSVVFAKINCPTIQDDVHSSNTDRSFMLWRTKLIFKSYFYLGKLEEALGLLEKQAELRNEIKALESSIPLAITRELLRHKTAGNEAFQSGRHTEAIEHYSAALSCNVESRPFAAICFCNRAAAYKALNQIVDAIADCSLAIALDQNYLKALSRRASLYEMIRDYGQAANDLERLVSLHTKQVDEKTNQSVISSSANDLRQAQLRLLEVEGEARKDIPLNMYLILGVEPSLSSAAEIKKAYRKAALRHHPDKAGQSLAKSDNGDDGIWREIAEGVYKDADRLFKMIGEAYAVLSNPIKRARYDLEEEMRTSQKKSNVSSTSRTHADVQNHPSERTSSSRPHWTDVRKSYWHS